jgi:oleate hydratase
MLPRARGDRPAVIPSESINLALIGQYVEIPDDTVFSMEYSVRSAQMAVFGLMGISKAPKKITRSCFAIFELLI